YRLNRRWDKLVGEGAKFPAAVLEIISAANRQGWIAGLIEAARAQNPGNAALYDFAQRLELVSAKDPELKQALEPVVKTANKFIDVATWRTKLGEIEPRICRIEIALDENRMTFGTGFLLSTSTLITNYHVMEAIVTGDVAAAEVVCRFDYKRKSANAIDEGK